MTTRVAILAGIGLLLFSSARAQDTATIVGTVTDSTGAVVPDVRITVSNLDKGLTRNLVSNEAGEYVAAALPIGDYSITAEAPGFRKLVRSGVTLEVGQKLRVDLKLAVGKVNQQVTVRGNTARVETETAAISEVITGRQIAKPQPEWTQLHQPGAAGSRSDSGRRPGRVARRQGQQRLHFV